MQRRLSVDVVGCGEIAQIMHLPNLFELSDMFTVRAICDKDRHVLKGVAERYGVDATFTDYREMLKTSPADALVVLSSGDHTSIVRDAIDEGMDVFVEKPLCYSTEAAYEIARRAKAVGKTVMVGYSRLFDSAFHALQDALEKQSGPVYLRAEAALPMDYYYRAHHDVVRPPDWTPPTTSAEWGGSWKYFYEEVLFNLAIHEVYCLRVLTGIRRPEILAASDVLDRRGVEASWRNGHNSHASMGVLTLDSIAGGYVEEFRAVTRSETYVLEYPSIYLKNWPAKLSWTELKGESLVSSSALGSYLEPFRAELEHFYDVLTGQRSCISSAEDAACDVETLNRIYAAAKAHWESMSA
jgi:predicted dehydrogenase